MLARQLLQDIKISTNTSHIGFYGETLAMQGLRNAGLSVYLSAYKKRSLSDLYVNCFHRVEVKTAKQNKSSYFKICLNKNDKHGMTTLSHADYVLIQLISASGLLHILFVPTSALVGKKSLHISIGSKFYNKYISSYQQIGKALQ